MFLMINGRSLCNNVVKVIGFKSALYTDNSGKVLEEQHSTV